MSPTRTTGRPARSRATTGSGTPTRWPTSSRPGGAYARHGRRRADERAGRRRSRSFGTRPSRSIVPQGDPAGVRALLARRWPTAGDELPGETFVLARAEHLERSGSGTTSRSRTRCCAWPSTRRSFRRPTGRCRRSSGSTRRRRGGAAGPLRRLRGSAYQPEQLASGVFYGVREGGRLVAAAGTTWSGARPNRRARQRLTRPEARGRGCALAASAAVAAELLAGPAATSR